MGTTHNSRDFRIVATMTDDNPLPVSRPQGGQKLDDTFPDGQGKASDDQPVLPSRQPVTIPADFPRNRN